MDGGRVGDLTAWIHFLILVVGLCLIASGLYLGVGLWAALLTIGVLFVSAVVYARVNHAPD